MTPEQRAMVEDRMNTSSMFLMAFQKGMEIGLSFQEAQEERRLPLDRSGSPEWRAGFEAGAACMKAGLALMQDPDGEWLLLTPDPDEAVSEPPEEPQPKEDPEHQPAPEMAPEGSETPPETPEP